MSLLWTYELLVGHDWYARFPYQPVVLCSSKAMVPAHPVIRYTPVLKTPIRDTGWWAPISRLLGGRAPIRRFSAVPHQLSGSRIHQVSLLLSGGCRCCTGATTRRSFTLARAIEGTRIWRMSLRAPVDAVALAARIRDELPSGTAQHFAAMVILNNLMSYSERYGLLLEHEDRAVVTSLSVEFLYLAWHYGVEIKLNQSHAKYWPLQIWKDSASLGINLKELVDIRESIDHDKLRNARTLLSFGAVVNQYFGIIRAQPNGLETFKNSYCPVVPGLSPVLPLPPNTPTLQPKPTKLGWSWANLWGRSGSRSPGLKPPSPAIEPLLIPGSMPPPPVDLLPFSTADTTFFPLRMESIPSASTEASSSLFPDSASSWTTESVPDSTVSAMDRLEAYLSVIGTPDCENVGYIPIRKKPLAPLEEAEQAIGKHRLFEPVRRTREELGHGPVIAQKDPLSWTASKPCGVRWMAAEELKVRQDKIEAQKMQQRAKELKKIKWKGAKSAQLMPRRAAVVQFQPRGTGNSPLAHEVKGEPEIIHINCD